MQHIKFLRAKSRLLLAAPLLLASLLSACGGNSETTYLAPATVKASCTNSNNWRSVLRGMNAAEVQSYLGPASTISQNGAVTILGFENCRAFLTVTYSTETDQETGESYTKEVVATVKTGGTVTVSDTYGVTAITSPVSVSPSYCELNYDKHFGVDDVANCRGGSNPY